jgi:hypothetical protein
MNGVCLLAFNSAASVLLDEFKLWICDWKTFNKKVGHVSATKVKLFLPLHATSWKHTADWRHLHIRRCKNLRFYLHELLFHVIHSILPLLRPFPRNISRYYPQYFDLKGPQSLFFSQSDRLCLSPLTKSVAPEPESSSPHSQQPTTSPYPESGESTPHPPTNLPKIHSCPILPSTPWPFKWSLSFGLSRQNPVHFSPLSHACHMPRPYYSPWFDPSLAFSDIKLHYGLSQKEHTFFTQIPKSNAEKWITSGGGIFLPTTSRPAVRPT